MAVPKGTRIGGRQKGTPNKATADIKALAQQYAATAMEELGRLAVKAESEAARVAAIKELFDRGFGKAKQEIDIDANVKATVDRIEREIVRPAHTHS